MSKLKILLADDHQMILDGLCAYLEYEEDLEVSGQVKDGDQVLRFLKEEKLPDLIIMDINMPNRDGIETTVEVKDKYPQIKILILSIHNKSEFVKRLINAGADGYILKDSGRKELIKAIRRIVAGEKYFSHDIMQANFEVQLLHEPGSPSMLTKREKQVVELIAEGLSSQEVAAQLNLSIHTVDSHRKKILAKIDGKNPVDIMRYALKTGIIKGFDIL